MTTNLLLLLILLVLLVQLHQQKPALPAGVIPGPIMWEVQRLAVQAGNVARLFQSLFHQGEALSLSKSTTEAHQ